MRETIGTPLQKHSCPSSKQCKHVGALVNLTKNVKTCPKNTDPSSFRTTSMGRLICWICKFGACRWALKPIVALRQRGKTMWCARSLSVKLAYKDKMVLKQNETEQTEFGKAITQFARKEKGRHRDLVLRQTIKYQCRCFVDELVFINVRKPQRGRQKNLVCTESSAHVRYMLRGTPPGTLSTRCSVGMHSFSSESAEINPGQAGGGMYLLLVKQTLQTKTTGSHRSLFSRI